MNQRFLPGSAPPDSYVIQKRADAEGLSLNKVVIRMLEEAAGQRRTAAKATLHHDLDHLAGTWSDAEAATFEASLAGQRKADPEIWG